MNHYLLYINQVLTIVVHFKFLLQIMTLILHRWLSLGNYCVVSTIQYFV